MQELLCSGTLHRRLALLRDAKPWLAVNPNYMEINAAAELADSSSIYHYTQKMILLRHATPALVYGDYQDLDPKNATVFIYTRTLGTDRYLIVLNFSNETLSYTLPGGLKPTQLVTSNFATGEVIASSLNLKGWEARVYKFKRNDHTLTLQEPHSRWGRQAPRKFKLRWSEPQRSRRARKRTPSPC